MAQGLQKGADPPDPGSSPAEKPGPHEGILDPALAARRFLLRRYHPGERLAAFVEHHWVIRWDLVDQPPYTAEVLPHPSLNVAFTPERGWITGVTTGTYAYEVRDSGFIVGTMFRPGGFRPFWRRSVAGLTDRVADAADAFAGGDAGFRAGLAVKAAEGDDAALVAAMEGLLLQVDPVLDRNGTLLNELLAALASDPELRTVASLADRAHVGTRTLQALFREYVGVGPKWVLMRHRLIAAVEVAARRPSPDWAEVAAELGYADQPHFINDFRRLVGKPPSLYAQTIESPDAVAAQPG
ncbi:MAG TPA: helix-turn-helix domain-containing protein [Candidatus Limnocylindrales bacterium]|nr:helix-turn-helix domain-containing protein [Candidatus Limnocylindrales bacterium]